MDFCCLPLLSSLNPRGGGDDPLGKEFAKYV